MIKKKKTILLFFVIALAAYAVQAQMPTNAQLDYYSPKEYKIAGINVTGAKYCDTIIIKSLLGIAVGDLVDIPGEKLSGSISKLWKQALFSDVQVHASKIEGNNAWLTIQVVELPRFLRPEFIGFEKSEREKLVEKVEPFTKRRVDENLLMELKLLAEDYIKSKGYTFANVTTQLKPDTGNYTTVVFNLTRGELYKINKINPTGNSAFGDKLVKRQMKNTKEKLWYRFFKKSKFEEKEYEADKKRVLDYYQTNGYNNATILHDSIYAYSKKLLNIDLTIEEGKLYYYRSITWVGNSLYSVDTLNKVLGLKKGDVYNMAELDKLLHQGPGGVDIAALYMDRGYLFFSVAPVVAGISGDSVDVELRIYEGKQAIINQVIIKGNTKTNDYIIRRELYTKPGQLFKRSDIIFSQRAILSLGYFDPAQLQINPLPNPTTGTVDIEYIVVEKPSDQITLSGGIGGGQLVGTLGLVFNNFSFKNFFKKESWRPVPTGDGKRLSINAQTNGRNFQSYNLSFTEPWLGGKKPNSLTNSIFYNIRNSDYRFEALGLSTSIGTRWKKPDTYFGAIYSLNLLRYNDSRIATGPSYNINLGLAIFRNSTNEGSTDYPTEGSKMSLSVQATPPWSAGNNLKLKDKLLEYHKWKFDLSWYQELAPKLVLNATAHFGYLGYYNKNIGTIPYERFYMGGIQIGSTSFVGQDFVNLRGYGPGAVLSPSTGSTLYSRFVLELRYPILQNKGSGISLYGLAFAEGGNAWDKLSEYNPINIKRSAGVGMRITLPMFGTLGLDYGYGFDRIERDGSGKRGVFHFVIGKDIN